MEEKLSAISDKKKYANTAKNFESQEGQEILDAASFVKKTSERFFKNPLNEVFAKIGAELFIRKKNTKEMCEATLKEMPDSKTANATEVEIFESKVSALFSVLEELSSDAQKILQIPNVPEATAAIAESAIATSMNYLSIFDANSNLALTMQMMS